MKCLPKLAQIGRRLPPNSSQQQRRRLDSTIDHKTVATSPVAEVELRDSRASLAKYCPCSACELAAAETEVELGVVANGQWVGQIGDDSNTHCQQECPTSSEGQTRWTVEFEFQNAATARWPAPPSKVALVTGNPRIPVEAEWAMPASACGLVETSQDWL